MLVLNEVCHFKSFHAQLQETELNLAFEFITAQDSSGGQLFHDKLFYRTVCIWTVCVIFWCVQEHRTLIKMK